MWILRPPRNHYVAKPITPSPALQEPQFPRVEMDSEILILQDGRGGKKIMQCHMGDVSKPELPRPREGEMLEG